MIVDKNTKLKENEKLKTKYKLKINIEKEYSIKKIKPKKLTKYEKLYKEAEKIKSILINEKILSAKMITTRTQSLYNSPTFKELIKIGNRIRVHENNLFISMLVTSCVSLFILIMMSYFLKNILFLPLYIFLQAFYIYLFNPKIHYKDFYNKIYLSLCYYCANFGYDEKVIDFKIYDLKQNWDKKTANKELVTNRFKVKTLNSLSTVEKKIIRNKISTYRVKKGILYVGQKLATIFSGYMFKMEYENGTNEYSDDLRIAIINKNTIYGTLGMSDDSLKKMKQVPFTIRHLNNNWLLYVKTDYKLSRKAFNEIQKKIMMIENEIGIFNAYISDNEIHFMLGIQADRNGINEDFFESSIRNDNGLQFGGFISIVKTIYIINCMYKLVGIMYPNSEIVYEKKRLHKSQFDKKQENKNKENIADKLKNIFNSKKGEMHLNNTTKVIITLIVSALIFVGVFNLLSQKLIPNVEEQYSKNYISHSSIIDEDTLK